ncbi:MAG: hypothetical protein Fur0037_13690 [Planctomycetota bacterium]
MTVAVQQKDGGISFAVKVVPGSRKQRIVGPYGGALKISVTAPPEKGKANSAVLELVAAALGVDPRDVLLTGGEHSPSKRIFVRGITVSEFRARLSLPD